MLKIQEKKSTPLLPLIQNYFQSSQKRSQLNQFISCKELTLVVIQKGPVMCITDMRHSIQAVKSKVSIEKIHPFSRQASNFYNIADRSWISFNARLQDLRQASQYPHSYQPCFYFKKQYEDYRKQRAQIVLRLQCEVIKVKKWSFRVVNISETGYYGLILELLEFRYTGQKSIQNVSDITSVLYQRVLKTRLEALRLDDLRNMYTKADNKMNPWSLFYECRNINFNPNVKKKLSNIIVIDKGQQMLNYDEQRKHHFVNFGVIEEANALQFPLNSQQIDYGRIKRINIQNMQVLFNTLTQQKYLDSLATNKRQGELWSSESEGSQLQEEKSNKSKQDQLQKQDSDDSQEDPLKNLYIKQFQNLKII